MVSSLKKPRNFVAKPSRKQREPYKFVVKKPLIDRLLLRVEVSENGCWEWQRALTQDGYPSVNFPEYKGTGHRLSYILHSAEDLQGYTVCHTCDNPRCVNPEHLYAGAMADNVRDRDTRGRCKAGTVNKAKTHCPSGHEYTVSNTYFYEARNTRYCKICQKERKEKLRLGTL